MRLDSLSVLDLILTATINIAAPIDLWIVAYHDDAHLLT